MSFTLLGLHKALFAYLALTIIFIVSGAFFIGTIKPSDEFDWFDAIGEGGITLMILIWIFFTLISRPSGSVTNLLFAGLTLTHVSMLLDFLDEFLRYPDDWLWLTTIESLPAPLGMVMMTFALYHWHQEQSAINNQLRRTERYYRERSLIDFTTGLYSAGYMRNQIKLEVNKTQTGLQQNTFALMMFDIRQFSKFNQNYGLKHGDSLLREVGQLIAMNIRDGDLACRYASDRFIVLLPNTTQYIANEIAEQTKGFIEHFAYKCDNTSNAEYPQVVTCSHEYSNRDDFDDILADINHQLTLLKANTNYHRSEQLTV